MGVNKKRMDSRDTRNRSLAAFNGKKLDDDLPRANVYIRLQSTISRRQIMRRLSKLVVTVGIMGLFAASFLLLPVVSLDVRPVCGPNCPTPYGMTYSSPSYTSISYFAFGIGLVSIHSEISSQPASLATCFVYSRDGSSTTCGYIIPRQ
jgi:hypothetical protein